MDDTKQGEQGSKPAVPKNVDPEKYRPLSDAPVQEVVDSRGNTLRLDLTGRLLCHARRRDGELCKSPAITGMKVCRMHGGSTDRAKHGAKLRLAELVNPAIATLAREMTQADKSADRQRAANSILDRAGHGRQTKIDTVDAKSLLYSRLLEIAEGNAAEEEREDDEVATPPADPQAAPDAADPEADSPADHDTANPQEARDLAAAALRQAIANNTKPATGGAPTEENPR